MADVHLRLSFHHVGWGLLGAGVLLIAAGVLPVDSALAVCRRVWPVLVFLLVIKVASDLLDAIGVFQTSTRAIAALGRGRTWVLFGLFVAVCVVATAVLSLDATAVLLTPVAITIARELRLPVLPFAVASWWLANTSSLALPVSNLTNLLAQSGSGWHPTTFVRHALPAHLAVVAVTIVVLVMLFGRSLPRRYVAPEPPGDARRPAFVVAVAAVAGFGVAVLVGVPPWLAGGLLVMVLLGVLGMLTDAPVAPRRLLASAPWSMAAFALGLFWISDAVSRSHAGWLAALVGSGEGAGGLLRTAVVGCLTANVVNNVPAYLVLEPATRSASQLMALLVGVNAGPLLTPWGSLATLLWLSSCRQRGVRIGLGALFARSLILVPLALMAGTLALAWAG